MRRTAPGCQRSASTTRASALLLAALVSSAPLGCGADVPTARPAGTPDLVVVVVDTLRADHLEVYGYGQPTSPLLTARATGWFLFENAQSAAPWTAPALISLMTSLYPAAHAVLGFPNPGRLADDATTLAEVLKRHGYATAAFTEGGYAKGDFGLDQGFDVYPTNPGDKESHWSNLLHPSRLEGNLDRAIDWIRRHRDEPFFVFFHTYEPHVPYRAPEPFIRRFRPDYDEKGEHERLRDAVERWNRTRRLSDEELLLVSVHGYHCRLEGMPELRSRPAFRRALRAAGLDRVGVARSAAALDWITDLYDAGIAYTDAVLERLWRELDSEALRDRTIVVLVSDHGEGLGEHGRLEHGGLLFEELLRVPLLMRIPGDAWLPRRIPNLVSTVDVVPTVLELMEIAGETDAFQGRSLMPLLSGAQLDAPAYSHGRNDLDGETDSLYTVRDGRWRLLADVDGESSRLFDLDADPGETRDVAAEHAPVAERLWSELRAQNERDRVLRASLASGREAPVLTPETIEELRQLGYSEFDESG